MRVARLWGANLAAPLAIVIVFAVGVVLTPGPLALPQGVTVSSGPKPKAIGEPVGLEIPSLGSEAPVVPIGVTNDVLISPTDVTTVGWWRESAQPGSPIGQSLLSGHAFRAGYSPMNNLRDIRRGATILIHGKDRTASYHVQDVFIWSKARIEKRSNDLFDPDLHSGRLVLVTSAGYNGKKWTANVIVFARPG